MHKQIFKKCEVLGEYYELTFPTNNSKSAIFFQQNSEVIELEGKLYCEISNNRRRMGGDDKIHKID
jgi:hypothetical protein